MLVATVDGCFRVRQSTVRQQVERLLGDDEVLNAFHHMRRAAAR